MSQPSQPVGTPRGSWFDLLVVFLVALAVPIGLRPVSAALSRDAERSYLPSLETFRKRLPFNPTYCNDLRNARPAVVLIGDSMLGSRINPAHMARVLKQRVWWVMQPGTGSAYWYLAFKNCVVGNGLRPKAVVFFFRDDNLTDILFRLDGQFRWSVDTLAGPTEPELDRAIAARVEGPWHRVHRAIDGAYAVAPVTAAANDLVRRWPTALLAGPDAAADFDKRLNAIFALDRLRSMAAADIGEEQTRLDFAHSLPRSILPEIIRLGREHGIRLAFVRVQRRPRVDGPPAESEALRRYVADLRDYLESNGAVFRDDTGDPDYPLAWYTDGDHTAGRLRPRYTELFCAKLAPLFE